MLINYVPGLALRFFPGLSREPNDAVAEYIVNNAKIAIFTGTAPTEQSLWNLTNFNDYVTANTDKLVYQETTQLKFTYDGFKHKRVIQRWPVDSTNITILNDKVAQDLLSTPEGEDAISTPNDLYALVYCPDKDVTLNTTGNDLIFLLPGVGSGSTDFCSLSTTDFAKDSEIYFRNMTVALFQGYQITDTLITEEQEDPENPGQMINVPVDTKKSVYINKVWGVKFSEAYRDCFVSRKLIGTKYNYVNSYNPYPPTFTGTTICDVSPNMTHYMQDLNFYDNKSGAYSIPFLLREYDLVSQSWKIGTTILWANMNQQIFNGFIVNQAVIDLIDEINNRSILGSLPLQNDLIEWYYAGLIPLQKPNTRFYFSAESYVESRLITAFQDFLPGLLVKYLIHQSWYSETLRVSYKQLMLELGFDESMIDRAIKSLVQLNMDITKWNSSYDKDNNVLTLQNNEPIKLKNRYKKAIQNPTNEALYILLPRYMIRSNFENTYPLVSNTIATTYGNYSSISSVTFPRTTKVLEGDNVDNFTQRVRINDYTAISIGQTGNGETDLEFDNIDVIDYIDSLTAMVKIPNKF